MVNNAPDAPINAIMLPERTEPVTPSKMVFLTVTLFPLAPLRVSVAYRFRVHPRWAPRTGPVFLPSGDVTKAMGDFNVDSKRREGKRCGAHYGGTRHSGMPPAATTEAQFFPSWLCVEYTRTYLDPHFSFLHGPNFHCTFLPYHLPGWDEVLRWAASRDTMGTRCLLYIFLRRGLPKRRMYAPVVDCAGWNF